MIFILDEWLIHDIMGQNGEKRQKEVGLLLFGIIKKCDKFAVVRGSKFEKKLYAIFKSNDLIIKGFAKLLSRDFIQNSQKTEIIDISEFKNLPDLNSILKDVNPDDHYLVKAYFFLIKRNIKTKIITTDAKLYEILFAKGVEVRIREDFIKDYLLY